MAEMTGGKNPSKVQSYYPEKHKQTNNFDKSQDVKGQNA